MPTINTMRAALLAGLTLAVAPAAAQVQLPPNLPRPVPTPNDALVSPMTAAAGVTFSLYAPAAAKVDVEGEMLPFGTTLAMTKRPDGVWTATFPMPPAGTFRYGFRIDGITIADPRNPSVSPTQTTVRSLVHVDGIAVEDIATVPHGAVAERTYASPVFPTPRRMHVYTPPGYEAGKGAPLPVLYLFHGGGDSDASWSTIGRAGVILDNLIAGGRAKPMIVVMPAGHVPASDGMAGPGLPGMTGDPSADPFVRDFLQAILPTIERDYRVRRDPAGRAIAGLSMGGIQSANIGLTQGDLFSQVAIFSSGWFPDQRAVLDRLHGRDLDAAKSRLKLLWIGWGKDDPLVPANAQAMVDLLKAHGLTPEVHVTDGSHDWATWRRYLATLAPMLFR